MLSNECISLNCSFHLIVLFKNHKNAYGFDKDIWCFPACQGKKWPTTLPGIRKTHFPLSTTTRVYTLPLQQMTSCSLFLIHNFGIKHAGRWVCTHTPHTASATSLLPLLHFTGQRLQVHRGAVLMPLCTFGPISFICRLDKDVLQHYLCPWTDCLTSGPKINFRQMDMLRREGLVLSWDKKRIS